MHARQIPGSRASPTFSTGEVFWDWLCSFLFVVFAASLAAGLMDNAVAAEQSDAWMAALFAILAGVSVAFVIIDWRTGWGRALAFTALAACMGAAGLVLLACYICGAAVLSFHYAFTAWPQVVDYVSTSFVARERGWFWASLGWALLHVAAGAALWKLLLRNFVLK